MPARCLMHTEEVNVLFRVGCFLFVALGFVASVASCSVPDVPVASPVVGPGEKCQSHEECRERFGDTKCREMRCVAGLCALVFRDGGVVVNDAAEDPTYGKNCPLPDAGADAASDSAQDVLPDDTADST